MSTRVFVIFFAVLFAVPVWAESKVQPVSVTNFPATQNVSGSVNVSNLPAVQGVSGEVAVSNLPAVQDVNVVNGCSSSAGAQVQLLGFTEAEVLGSTGFFALVQACSAEFPGSQVCTSLQVLEATSVPEGLTGRAWIRPVFVPFGLAGGTTTVRGAFDISGTHASPSSLSCGGWYFGSGLTVSSTGGFTIDSCGTPFAVACCGVPQ